MPKICKGVYQCSCLHVTYSVSVCVLCVCLCMHVYALCLIRVLVLCSQCIEPGHKRVCNRCSMFSAGCLLCFVC